MEDKILNALNQLKEQMNKMQTQMDRIESDVSFLKSDVSSIKETVDRIEVSQQEDIIATLQVTNKKVDELQHHQDDTDNVIDVLAARTIRLEARRNPH